MPEGYHKESIRCLILCVGFALFSLSHLVSHILCVVHAEQCMSVVKGLRNPYTEGVSECPTIG